ncbi:hypothetical protein KFL_007360040 [Klebsormidium nitens]|uniref:Uncharacterized protein n=1 Tax=Klebsormidium nitens TaxID=105231 RepID=A0A1Y1IQW6_KLENI|nr:hypothetical protein KFL_007360040 [Klebsormidium nitens]|eukprot:GAQ91156.1 hypothetical protein KFL_007360040 [Klebsormidium nitens]
MASMDAAQLMSCELYFHKVTIDQNADNPTVLTEHFIGVAECMEEYFSISDKEAQSTEVKESRSKFGWAWLELPQFPMRELLPVAAKALQRFPMHRGLVLAIADWCIDVCKSNVLAKMEAMRCGMLQGLCLAAGHLALCETFGNDEYLLAGCIFEALRKAAETPSLNFFSRSMKVKDEFYAVAREAWLGVRIDTVLEALEKRGTLMNFEGPQAPNPALVLTALFLRKGSDWVTMELYLQVVKSLGEAFGNTFPTIAENQAFERFLNETFEGFRGKVLPDARFGSCGDLLDEARLIHMRRLYPSDIPWDHRNSCLNPTLNELYRNICTVSEAQISEQVVVYNKIRRNVRR